MGVMNRFGYRLQIMTIPLQTHHSTGTHTLLWNNVKNESEISEDKERNSETEV